MKIILSLLLLVGAVTTQVLAQDFEGTLTWKMTAEISDPALRAQMDQASAQMASPEMQAKMAQARAAMASPEMQAMLKQNPQMAAMIEKQMGAMNNLPKPGAGGSGRGGLFPSKFVCKTKGARALIVVEGGMFPSETLSLGDQGVAYRIDRAGRTYQRMPSLAASLKGAATGEFKVTATSETLQLLGYRCTRHLIEQTSGRERATYAVWATKEIPGLDSKKLAALRVGRESGPNFMTEIDGVPLKVEVSTPQAKLTMQVESITPGALPATTFEIPAGFTEAKP